MSAFTNGPSTGLSEGTMLNGYLNKKTRDGRWQKRWFETNGVYLTYYKSKKMDKLLAALSLPQVGAITQIPKEKDPEGQVGLFALELNSRMYTLRAKDDEEAAKWVHVLETLRQQGIAAAAKEAEARGGSTTVNVRAKSGIEMETVGVSNSGSSSSAASDASWIKSSNPYCCC